MAVVARGGDDFVTSLRRTWDAGDAVLPLDPRLPTPAAEALLDALGPAAVVDPADGVRQRRAGGRSVETGDALVVATSGTTGAPKGAVLTHDAVAASARATSAHLGVDPAGDRWLACLPLAHVGGLSVVTRALHTDTPLTVLPGPDPAAVEAAARTGGATLVSLVATALSRLDASRFRAVVLGGAAAPAEVASNVHVTWGMTETGSGVVYDRRAIDGVELRIVDGELWVRGPMLARAYRDGTPTLDADRWLHTGDAGELVDGRLHVAGRMGDVIVTGAEKVWPAPVEAALLTLASVAEVAVTGRPDPEWGQVVVAWVVPADHARPPALDELREAVLTVLPAWCAPRRLVIVEGLARTALGKVRRAELPDDSLWTSDHR